MDSVLAERVVDLADIRLRFSSVHTTVWALVLLNFLLLLVVTALTYLFHVKRRHLASRSFLIAYRGVLAICLLFFILQLIKLFYPLLVGAIKFPGALDRLFSARSADDGILAEPISEETRKRLLGEVEHNNGCVFDAQEVMVSFGIQNRCLPKLKDNLLPVYTVLLLILVDLVPFLFPVATFFWASSIKELGPIKTLREGFLANQQQRHRVGFKIPDRNKDNPYTSIQLTTSPGSEASNSNSNGRETPAKY